MLLVSISERTSRAPRNYSTVNDLVELYRGLCVGLDVQKFLSMSNFDLLFCDFRFNLDELLRENYASADMCNAEFVNLADSVYQYMSDNIDVYFDTVKSIDEYREKIKNYKLDK